MKKKLKIKTFKYIILNVEGTVWRIHLFTYTISYIKINTRISFYCFLLHIELYENVCHNFICNKKCDMRNFRGFW